MEAKPMSPSQYWELMSAPAREFIMNSGNHLTKPEAPRTFKSEAPAEPPRVRRPASINQINNE